MPVSLVFKRLSRTPLLLGGALLIGLALALAAIDTVHGYRAALREANTTLDNVEGLLDEYTTRAVEGADGVLRHTVDNLLPVLQRPESTRADISHVLARQLASVPYVRALLLAGPDGRNLGDSDGGPPVGRPGAREYFRAHVDNPQAGLIIGRPGIGTVSGRWNLPLSRRIDAPDGTFLGVVVIFLEPDHFVSIYRALQLGEHGSVSLFRRDGIVLFRTYDTAEFIGRDLGDRPLFKQLLPQAPKGRNWVPGGIDGITRLVSYSALSKYPLVITIGLSEVDIFRTWRARSVIVGTAALLVCLAISGFVWLLAQQLQRQQSLMHALTDATKRANAANRMKSEFLANMSHELRTPLNAVIGFAEVLNRPAIGELNDRQREYVADIAAAGRHLLDLISDVLNFAKIEAGGYQLDEETFELSNLVEETVRLMAPAALKAEVSLQRQEPAPEIVLRADRRALKQMLVNLQSNAIKFTPKQGQVEVGYTVEGRWLTIHVRDTGIGIPADQQQHVLEPFTQISNAFNRTHQGTGLGLPIVRSLVEMHGGELLIDSAAGAGTTVKLRLPAERILPPRASAVA